MKSSAQDRARRHAQDTARRGGTVMDCGYKSPAWRAVWLKEFERAQQRELFKKNQEDDK